MLCLSNQPTYQQKKNATQSFRLKENGLGYHIQGSKPSGQTAKKGYEALSTATNLCQTQIGRGCKNTALNQFEIICLYKSFQKDSLFSVLKYARIPFRDNTLTRSKDLYLIGFTNMHTSKKHVYPTSFVPRECIWLDLRTGNVCVSYMTHNKILINWKAATSMNQFLELLGSYVLRSEVQKKMKSFVHSLRKQMVALT